jgi:hypothetical protein
MHADLEAWLEQDDGGSACQTMPSPSNIAITLTEEEYARFASDGVGALYTPVENGYTPQKEYNPFIQDWCAVMPRWMLRVCTAQSTVPTDFLERVTVADLEATSQILRRVAATDAFANDVRFWEKCCAQMDDGEVFGPHFYVQLWGWVSRVLISVVATRFVMSDVMQCTQTGTDSTIVGGGTSRASRNRNVKQLLWWSPITDRPESLTAWMYRLAIVDRPGWVRTFCRSGKVSQAFGRTQRQESVHAVIDAVIRVGQDDWRTPMLCSGTVCSESTARVQARALAVPSSAYRPNVDAGLYVSPMMTLLPQHCSAALQSFLCTRDLTRAFENMPLSAEARRRAVDRAFATKLPDIFAHRAVVGVSGADSMVAGTWRVAAEPLFATTENSAAMTCVAISLRRHTEKAQTSRARRLTQSNLRRTRVSSVPALPVGAVPIQPGSVAYEEGLYECVMGPIARFCESVWGREGFDAFVRRTTAAEHAVDGVGHWEFEPKAPAEFRSAHEAYTELRRRGLEAARARFVDEAWGEPNEEDDGVESEAEDGAEGEAEDGGERRPKRRRLQHDVTLTRRLHLDAVQHRIDWGRVTRGVHPGVPFGMSEVETSRGKVWVQTAWRDKVDGS